MDQFTYETKDNTLELETYEWDNVWWEQASDQSRPRVLYIGDSISCGIRQAATRGSGEKLLFDGFGTSKAVDNSYFKDSIRLFARQQRERRLVIFNNGLHGFHLNDREQYKAYYEGMVQFLLEEFPESAVALVLTTSVSGLRQERVLARNQAVEEIAGKYKLPVINLYAASVEYAKLRSEDRVHYTEEGYERLAERLLAEIGRLVPGIF